MKTLRLTVILVLLACASRLSGDVAPPPGKKWVPVTTVVEAAEEFSDYVFFTLSFSRRFAPPRPPDEDGKSDEDGWRTDKSVSVVTISPGRPIQDTGELHSASTLYAVPRATAKKYPDFANLAQDVHAKKVLGATQIRFGTTMELSATDPREAITVRYRAEKSPNGGIAFTLIDDDTASGVKYSLGEEEAVADEITDPNGTFSLALAVAGGAAALGAVLTGLWLLNQESAGVNLPGVSCVDRI